MICVDKTFLCIASDRAKGQGLLGHCPEAKTHFTVYNRDPNTLIVIMTQIQHTTIHQSKILYSK